MYKLLVNRFYILLCGMALVGLVVFVSVDGVRTYLASNEAKEKLQYLASIRNQIDSSITNTGEFPSVVTVEDNLAKIDYTFDEDLTNFVKNRLKKYRSDYSVITVIDNNSGEILTSVGYRRKGDKFDYQLPFSSTHPSASLIKIVTSAGLLASNEIDLDTVFSFRGRGTTLYKYQLKDKRTRWSRYLTFEKAFALSNNVVFGKAAMNYLSSLELFKMASSFGFNKNLIKDISAGKSVFPMPTDKYNLAELACGFNDQAMISPIHAAVLSSIVANNGTLKYPRLIDKVVNLKTNEIVLDRNTRKERVLEPEIVDALKEMMELTVSRGTAKSAFKQMQRSIRNKLEIGGKTGSITGGVPFGKRDWFTAFARPKENAEDLGISISVMNINVNKWYVKSSYLAKEIIEHFYKKKVSKKLALKQ